MTSGWYILGEEVERFEDDYAAYCDAAHGVGLASGRDALNLALRAVWAVKWFGPRFRAGA
jgi:dTDP-4-amino-4,6-dideoxygalactose transaminase